MHNMNIALKSLLEKREQLVSEKTKMLERFNTEIGEIEDAIEQLSGQQLVEKVSEISYDDESPNYVRSSQEEI